jgi:uncharacterized protein involved in exopolysaccharide biosynthesis
MDGAIVAAHFRWNFSSVSNSDAELVDDDMDLRAIVSRLFARKWWIVASVVVFTGGFYIAAHVLTPVYRGSTILIPAKADHGMDASGGGIGGVASLVGIDIGGSDSDKQEALAVLKSRHFTEKFISDLNLMPVLYAKKWDAQAGKWKVDEKHQPTLAKAYHHFDKDIRAVVLDKKTGLITLNVDWTDRIAAAVWANELVDRLNLEMRQRALARADSEVGYLEREFESTTAVATREAIGHLIESQVKQRMLAAVTTEFALRVIDRAMPSDKDDPHFPNKFLMIIAGPIVGFIFGALCVLGYAALKEPVARPATVS